jgi:hypothetical protein
VNLSTALTVQDVTSLNELAIGTLAAKTPTS